MNCGSSSSPSGYGSSATATPTPIPAYTISGTVTYQGAGSGSHTYVLLQYQSAAGPASIVGPLASGASYSFSGLTSAAEVGASYDTAGNGLVICGNNVQGTGCTGLTHSGDIVCIVGYNGACPNSYGTYYSTTSAVNIVFGGSTGQSGTNCTE
jgi:hypothetical protein